mgnify:CR=1 FL=1
MKIEEINYIKKVSFINEFGETMNLILDENHEVWFNHEDCNGDNYQKYNNLLTNYKLKSYPKRKIIKGFAFVLSSMESSVLNQFVDEAVAYNGFKRKSDDVPLEIV